MKLGIGCTFADWVTDQKHLIVQNLRIVNTCTVIIISKRRLSLDKPSSKVLSLLLFSSISDVLIQIVQITMRSSKSIGSDKSEPLSCP
jgi:hypothetical protein